MNIPTTLNYNLRKRINFFYEVVTSIPKNAEIVIDRELFASQKDEPLTFNCPVFNSRYIYNEVDKIWELSC